MTATQRCDAAYKQAVLLKCYEALAEAGFTRFRKEHVDWPLENGFHCWVGLNTALEKEYVQINPFVGVHVVPLEKFWTGLKSGKFPGKYNRAHATFAIHMGLITPHAPVFKFTRQVDIDAESARLARLYAGPGLAYAKSIASYDYLLPLLQDRISMLGAYPERVAACLYLMGRKDEARSFVEVFLNTKRNYFEGFAAPFLELLTDPH